MTVTGDDVLGPGEFGRALKEFLDASLRLAPVEHRERLLAAGRHLKRRLLLHGPPGTGKTMTAMYLVTHMPGRTTVLLSGGFFGLIGAACTLARELEPATVILEDVDLFAHERGYGDLYGRGLDVRAERLDGLVERLDGVSPAHIKKLLRKAAVLAAIESDEALVVEDRHLEEAAAELSGLGSDA
jgi:SpoVK/Ycf46/Vps4 family AAA+-type ATPase